MRTAVFIVVLFWLPQQLLAQVPGRPRIWWPGDLHAHTIHSLDAAALGGDDVARTIRLGEKQGLTFLAITDHQSIASQADPAFASAKLTPVPSLEWGIMGHTGIHGTRTLVPEVDRTRPPETWNIQVDLTLAGARARGSVVVVNHPAQGDLMWSWTTAAFDAVEVWNVGWVFPFVRPMTRERARAELAARGLSGVPGALSPELASAPEVNSGGCNVQSLRFWENHLANGERVGAVGGSDRHVLVSPGYPTTWASAPDRSLPEILNAIREGRTAVTRGPRVRPPELTASAGGRTAQPGDTLPAGQPVRLTLRMALPGGGLAVIYRGREIVATAPVGPGTATVLVNDTPSGPTWYRAEVFEPLIDLGLSAGDRVLWNRLAAAGPKARPEDLNDFLSRFGERVDEAGRWPSFAIPDALGRFLNADPRRPGHCISGLTSAIFVR
ncbi:MAG: CehA/McbA family metallohydrolase [Candidatus Riflebacteria bacterium]|nr:CehA/McbA family metallohydrolase [Candidatus Riflebacteria bacterium]